MKTHLGIAVVALLGACLFLGWRLFGQIHDQDSSHQQLTVQGMSLQDLQMMRHDIQKQKQKLIAENLLMVEPEAIKFWAVYQKYSAELKQINDEKFAMIHAYSQSWKSMSDDDALIFTRRWLELDESVVQLRSKHLPLEHLCAGALCNMRPGVFLVPPREFPSLWPAGFVLDLISQGDTR
jgi:cell division protein FtsB